MSSRFLLFKRYFLPATAIGFGTQFTQSVQRSPHPSSLNHPSHYDHHIHSTLPKIKQESVGKRPTQIQRLKSGETFDVLVVGGGCVGSGIALDAATRGLSVALVERDDFSSGTSSRSTKLIHGGVRYLEKAFKGLDYKQLSLVIDALNERRHLISITPHLSQPVPIIVPIYHKYPQVLFYLPYYWVGMKMYDFFAGSDGLLRSSFYLNKTKVMEKFPMLNERGLKGAIVYYDGMHNDARMNLALALTASAKGAAVANHCELVEFKHTSEGKVCGATLRDTQTGEVWDVKCKVAVNATGPFCDLTRKLDDKETKEITTPSAGTHIVLPNNYSPEKMGMLIPNTDDGRVIFLLPQEGSTLAGTTDAKCAIKHQPSPTEDDVSFIIKEVGRYLNTDLKIEDVDAAQSGIRPLAHDPNSKNTQSISRDHVIDVAKSGLLTITGGKWTTYRKMAEDVVDRILKDNLKEFDDKAIKSECVTTQTPLVGASGWSLSVTPELVRKGFSHDISEHLSHNYGCMAFQVAEIALDGYKNPLVEGYPYIEAEVLYSARNEYALNTVDVIARRMRLAFLNSGATMKSLPRVISLLAQEHNQDAERCVAEYREACDFIETMNVSRARRHFQELRQPILYFVDRTKTMFGECPFDKNSVSELQEMFKSLQTPTDQQMRCNSISKKDAIKIVDQFSSAHRDMQKYSAKMISSIESRNSDKITWEDFLFSISSAALTSK